MTNSLFAQMLTSRIIESIENESDDSWNYVNNNRQNVYELIFNTIISFMKNQDLQNDKINEVLESIENLKLMIKNYK